MTKPTCLHRCTPTEQRHVAEAYHGPGSFHRCVQHLKLRMEASKRALQLLPPRLRRFVESPPPNTAAPMCLNALSSLLFDTR